MKILQASFDGVGGVPDISIDLRGAGGAAADLVLVTGRVGAGKTRLLEALCAAKELTGPYGTLPRAQDWVRAASGSAKITVHWGLDEEEQKATGAGSEPIRAEAILGNRPVEVPEADAALVHVLETYDHHPGVSKLEYFHARRRLPRSSYAYVGRPPTVDAKRRARLVASDEKYDGVRQFLLELCLGLHEHDTVGEAGVDRFAAAFRRLCPSKQFEGLANGSHGQRVVFSDALGNSLDLDHLSEGEKQAVLFAATFEEVGLNRSVVLVDTPELFLPEPEVVAFVDGLRKLGASNQLIVATTSPALLASVPPRHVVRLP